MSTIRTAKDIRGPSPLIAVDNEAPAKLMFDPPLPEPLAQGRVFIRYRTENLGVVPVFGEGALSFAPHRTYEHHCRQRAVALRRQQRRNDHLGGLGTWPAPGLDRISRPHP